MLVNIPAPRSIGARYSKVYHHELLYTRSPRIKGSLSMWSVRASVKASYRKSPRTTDVISLDQASVARSQLQHRLVVQQRLGPRLWQVRHQHHRWGPRAIARGVLETRKPTHSRLSWGHCGHCLEDEKNGHVHVENHLWMEVLNVNILDVTG